MAAMGFEDTLGRKIMPVLALPEELVAKVVKQSCPTDCLLRWSNACRLARTCRTIWALVLELPVFTDCGDVDIDGEQSLRKFQFASSWRALFPTVKRAFSCALASRDPTRPPVEAAILVSRNGLAPLWRLVIFERAVGMRSNANIDFVWTYMLSLRDVMSYVRCPPGFEESQRSEKDELEFMEAANARAPGTYSACDFADADQRTPRSGGTFSKMYSIDPCAIRPVHATLSDKHVSTEWFSRLISPSEVVLRVTCSSRAVDVRNETFFYHGDLEIWVRPPYRSVDYVKKPPPVKLIFHKAVRTAAGFSAKHTVDRFEFDPNNVSKKGQDSGAD